MFTRGGHLRLAEKTKRMDGHYGDPEVNVVFEHVLIQT